MTSLCRARRWLFPANVQLASAEAVWCYLRNNPEQYALAAWDVGNESKGVFHDADRAWPLASTMKIIILALACHRLENGEWAENTIIGDIDLFYLPGTDGGAHSKAVKALGGKITTLGEALSAMIQFSDNAASDAILFELGKPAVDAEVKQLGVFEPPHPIAGTMALMVKNSNSGDTASQAWALTKEIVNNSGLRIELGSQLSKLPLKRLSYMVTSYDNKGSARALGKLIESFYTDQLGLYAHARRRLSWPLHNKDDELAFRLWGTKGGSLPGVLTSVHFAESLKGNKRIVALFLHDLPISAWAALTKSFAHQMVELEILNAVDLPALIETRLGLSEHHRLHQESLEMRESMPSSEHDRRSID